jgi:hypothetical protein
MSHVLLLGAGFTRNWGGWLAAEAFEYLLGCQQVDPFLRNLLWKHRRSGGYERALEELQDDFFRRGGDRAQLSKLEDAIAQMLTDMNKGFESIEFEFQTSMQYMVRAFLVRFDAIFTLNQDLLLERRYLGQNIALGSPTRRWTGWQIPGMRREPTSAPGSPGSENCGIWVPGGNATPQPGYQLYFKLHGSSNWRDSTGARIIVAGGNKPALISRYPVLARYHEAFRQHLAGPTHVMVIGYSFGDQHINDMLMVAAATGQLNIFIIDPLGLDVIDENRLNPLWTPGRLLSALGPSVSGGSRRSLGEIFGPDRVEHAKVMSFLE